MSQELEQNITGLQNIYLNNSIFTGLLSQISCEGHTVNFGNNGAGKTTILNLIPIFYGLKPNRLISQRGNKLSFVDFYLPYSTSIIVFEYLKNGEARNALIFRHNDTFRYCFVKGKAEDLLFSEEAIEALKKINSTENWIKQYLQINKNYEVSKIIDSSELYQAILMNNRDIISQRRDRSEFALTASKFALCSSREEIRNLASLTAVMLSDRSKLLEELKQMLVMCYVSNQVSINLPKTRQGRSDLEELEAVSELSSKIKNFNQAVEIKKEIADDWGFISECERNLKQLSQIKNQERDQLKTVLTAKREELKTTRDNLNEVIGRYTEQKSEAEHQKNSAFNLIEKLQNQKDIFDAGNIAEKSESFEQLANYKGELDRALKYRNDLQQDFQDKSAPIELKKSNRVNELITEKNKVFQKLTRELADNKDKLNSIEEKFRNREQHLKDEMHTKLVELESQFKAREKELDDKVRNLTNQKFTDGNFTTEEENTLQTAQRDLDRYTSELFLNLKAQTAKQQEIDGDKNSLKEISKQIASLSDRHSKLLKEKSEVLEQLNPPETSLIGFMEKNLPGWRDNVGKVLRKELLFTKGLKPYLADNDNNDDKDHNSVFGLGFSLDEIDTPDYIKSRAEIEEKSLRLDEEIMTVADAKDKQEKILASAQNTLSVHENELSDLKREEKNLSENQSSAKSNLEELTAKFKQNCAERLKVINEEIDNCSTSKNRLEISMQNNRQKHAEFLKNRLLDYKADFDSESAPVIALGKALQERLDSLDDEYQQKYEDIESSYKEELIKSGINYEILKKAQEECRKAKEIYNRVLSYEEEVTKYNVFMAGPYSLLETHRKDLAMAEDLFEKYSSLIATEKQKLKELETEFTNEINRLRTQIENLDIQCNAITSFFSSNQANLAQARPEFEDKAYLPENLSIENMICRCEEKLKAVFSKQEKLINNVDSVRRTMENQTGPQNRIGGYWNKIIEDLKVKFGNDINANSQDIRFYFALTDRLASFITSDFKILREAIIKAFVSSAIEFSNFYENLRHFNNVVRQVSGSFEKRLTTYNPLDTITDIKVGLVSKIENLEMYPKLASFAKCYNSWDEENRGNGDLVHPSEELIKYFSYVSQALVNNEIDSDINTLIDINISMNINGRHVVVRSDRDLTSGGSTGESKLAINVIFCGLTRMLCPDPNIKIHWPIDEIGEIYNDNLQKIFTMTERYGIYLFCAQPNLSYDKVQMFNSKNNISRTEGVKRCVEGYEEDPDNPLIDLLTEGKEA